MSMPTESVNVMTLNNSVAKIEGSNTDSKSGYGWIRAKIKEYTSFPAYRIIYRSHRSWPWQVEKKSLYILWSYVNMFHTLEEAKVCLAEAIRKDKLDQQNSRPLMFDRDGNEIKKQRP